MSARAGASARWTAVAAPGLVALVTLVAFAPVLGAGFVNWDDTENFLTNPAYRGLGPEQLRWMFSTFHQGVYVPLAWLTLGLDYRLWGMDARGYHATSLAFHVATAIGLYFLALRLFRHGPGRRGSDGARRAGAAAAALFFAVHPLRAESVAWVTERRDVVSGSIAVLCVLAYLKAAEHDGRDRRWYWLAVLLFLGALLGKVITAMLAPVLLLLDVYPLRRLGGARGWGVGRVWLEKLPFFALAGAFSALGFVAVAAESYLRPVTEMGLGFRIVLSLWGTAFYLLKTVWPTGLSPLYQLPFVVTWAHFALVGAATALALGAWRRWPAFSLAWAAYLVLLFPVAGLFHNGPQAAADRYSYLACIPWALLAGAAVAGAHRYPVAARVGAAGVVAVLAGLTWQQAAVWRDGVSLWSHAVRVNPASRAAHAKLGEAYAAEGRLLEAAAHYAETLRLSSNKAPYHVIVGRLLARAGLGDGAAAHFRAALALRPGLPEACAGLQALDTRRASGGALAPGCPADGQAGPSGRSTSSSR